MHSKQFFKLTLFLFFILGKPILLSAQGKWKPSYLLISEKDTLKGEVEVNWNNNPSGNVVFRNPKGEKKEYSAKNIIEFGYLDGTEVFKSATFEVEKREQKGFQTAKNAKILTEQISVFVRTLLSGNISLYVYHDTNRGYFLVQNKYDDLKLLKYYQYYTLNAVGEKVLVIDNQYRNQLNKMLEKTPNLALKTKSISYRESSLLQLLKTYHKEVEEKYTIKGTPNPWHIGVMGGITINNIKFLGPSSNEIYLVDFKSVITPTMGIAFEKYFNPQRKSLSFCGELARTGFKTNETLLSPKDINSGAALIRTWKYKFDIQHLKLTALMRYKFTASYPRLYFNAGFGYGISLRTEQVSILEKTVFPFSINAKTCLIGGIGAHWKKWNIDARYERNNIKTINLPVLNRGSALLIAFTYWFI